MIRQEDAILSYAKTSTRKVAAPKHHQWYVTMTDNFMSGWGCAKGKKNKLVIACDTLGEAEIVEAQAHRRSEMRYVNICSKKPSYPASRFMVSWHDKTDYDRWFDPSRPFGA